MKIAAIGECLLELTERSPHLMALNYAGDTYNTCYYLALLNPQWHISYVTALGCDPYSQAMKQAWHQNGINTELCVYFDDKLPGLYLVNTDDFGERSFYYYRSQSAASQLLSHPEISQSLNALLDYDFLYLSGISFAIMSPSDRMQLLEFIRSAKEHGVGIIYDNNYRAKLWANKKEAQDLVEQLCPLTDCFFVTHADESLLFGDIDAKATYDRYLSLSPSLLVVKDGEKACLVSEKGHLTSQCPPTVEQVIDTTGAGDAFNAGFLSVYWQDVSIQQALEKAHNLAAKVIQCQGAIISQLF